MLDKNFSSINKLECPTQQNFKRKYLLLFIVMIVIFLFISYLFWQKKIQRETIPEQILKKNEQIIEKSQEQKIDQVEIAKDQFLQMKMAINKIQNIDDALALSQKYFTINLQTKINQNIADSSDEKEKLNLFWETVKGNVALIEDVNQIDGTAIDDTHIKLTIETKFTILELILVWENNAWRYNGEEKITHIIDEIGKTYKVVTKNEAEYEIITDKNGKEIFRLMKDGQAILDDITSTNAAILINK